MSANFSSFCLGSDLFVQVYQSWAPRLMTILFYIEAVRTNKLALMLYAEDFFLFLSKVRHFSPIIADIFESIILLIQK